MYEKESVKLAAMVLDGKDSMEFMDFRDQWEKARPFHRLGWFEVSSVVDNAEFYGPIFPSEIRENLTRLKNELVPGPDRISKWALLTWDPGSGQLAWLFIAWLVQGVISMSFRECHTRLLPMYGWCPVTLAPWC